MNNTRIKTKGQNEGGIVYYNLEINSANQISAGLPYDPAFVDVLATTTVYNNIPVLKQPQNYFGSIVRLEFAGSPIPLIKFDIQSGPVSNINLGVYSFTLQYNGIRGAQTFYIFVPEIRDPRFLLPKVGTQTQDFTNPYYFLYDYSQIIRIMNTALATAFTSLLAQGGTGPIAAAKVPFFNFDEVTGLISLYTDPAFFDQGNSTITHPIYIYFNQPSYAYLIGLPYIWVNTSDANGLDNYIVVDGNHGINFIDVNAVQYVQTSQQFVAVGYMSPLKSIQIVTTMGIKPEGFNVSSTLATPSNGVQSIDYSNVITDFLPDVSQPTAGVSSYRQIYNAPSLYRLFEFKNDDPLYEINAKVSWQDFYGNSYPLSIDKGQSVLIKYMFIEKSLISKCIIEGNMV